MKRRQDLIGKIIFTILGIIGISIGVVYTLMRSNLGSQAIIWGVNRFYCKPYTIDFSINKMEGNFINKLYFTGININLPKINTRIYIKQFQLNCNFFRMLINQKVNIQINDLSGNVNNYPLQANFNINWEPKQIRFVQDNFLLIGANIIQLEQSQENYTKFALKLNQLNLLHPNLFGKLNITGKLLNNLQGLTANILSQDLKFQQMELYRLTNSATNKLDIEVTRSNNLTNLKLLIDWNDFTGVPYLIPILSKIKGHCFGRISLIFDQKLLKVDPNLNCKNFSMHFPIYSLKINPVNLVIHSDQQQILIHGEGWIKNTKGQFNLVGNFDPFNFEQNNKLKIYAKNLEIADPNKYHLFGDLDLDLFISMLKRELKIIGSAKINEGTIHFEDPGSNIVRSKDIKIIQHQIDPISTPNNFKIVPEVNLRIEDQTQIFSRYLDAIISGKIHIYTLNDHDNTLLGEGRITIKHGTYKMSGIKFIIEKGRIIYLPGTILSNPLLDIKILPNQLDFGYSQQNKYIYVEGTIDNPIMKNSGMFDQSRAISHLLNFTSNKLGDLQSKFKIEEFEIEENKDLFYSRDLKNTYEPESLLDHKSLVIGKKLSSRSCLKYMHSLSGSKHKFQFQQKLHKNWAIEIESSSTDPYGADLTFFKEKS